MTTMLINLTIPVYNEQEALPSTIAKLVPFLSSSCHHDWEIVIADNGSTDSTLAVARKESQNYSRVRVAHLDCKGRGRALKYVWRMSQADILSYMDVDLSTDLGAFPGLIEALSSGKFDVATGSRLKKESQVIRGIKREIISRCYNRLVKSLFSITFSDAQCGFKAITREAALSLLPMVEDVGWFFDTELLILGEKLGYRICELPVRWVDDPDSRVKIYRTAWDDLKGLARLYGAHRGGAWALPTGGTSSEAKATHPFVSLAERDQP